MRNNNNGGQTPTRAPWRLIATLSLLLPSLVLAGTPVQVSVPRPIAGAPPVFQAQPDLEIPGRFVGFTAGGCAVSFAASALRGLTWTGSCAGGRAQGQGTLLGYDYEQQVVFVFEGNIERGLRTNGVMHEVDRKEGRLIGLRTALIGAVLQPRTEMRFLDMPRPFLLALDDYVRQTEGRELLASMVAAETPSSQPAASVLGQLLGAVGQYQQAKADRLQAQNEEQQRQLQAQQEQQRRLREQQEQQRILQEQNRAYAAEAARAEAFNRESALAAGQRATQQASPANGNTAVGREIYNPPSQPQRSASEPRPMGHIELNRGGPESWGQDTERLARENRERERDYRAALKQHEIDVRRNQAARAEAQRQREAEEKRQLQAQLQAKASERSNLEAKIRAAIFGSGAIAHYIDRPRCQKVFTNTTSYWITVVWDYTVVIEDAQGARSEQSQAALEVPPGQTRTWPVWAVICGDKETNWNVAGEAVTRKDNLNNYPYHLR